MARSSTARRQDPDGGKKLREEGKAWLARIDAAEKLEKDWVKDAEAAEAAYTGEKTTGRSGKNYDFNILFANVETIVPAIINSPPQPDIRQRFGDDDPVAKDVSEINERAIRISVDDGKLQTELEQAAQDSFLAGRGLVRLRFHADIDQGGELEAEDIQQLAQESFDDRGVAAEDDAEDDAEGAAPIEQTEVRNERFAFEAVSWRDYRHGPAKRWDQRPWEAYKHSFTADDVDGFADKAMVAAQTTDSDSAADRDAEVTVWEIWDRRSRKVKFVDETTGKILRVVDDPLGLTTFYPCCTPMQPIEVVGRLKPVNPFSIYRKLAEELDTTTKRIAVITKAMKVKGWYAGDATDMAALESANDNEFVPISDAEVWASHGGIAGAMAFWPIEKFITVLRELYSSREQTKQAIYEITGISDIVRGAGKASETATAQSIKSQWGSLRIQKMQRMMERAARDLFVMMTEIIGRKFSAQTLQDMTSIQLVPTEQDLLPVLPQVLPKMDEQQAAQAQQEAQAKEIERQKRLAHMEAVNALLTSGLTRNYRVDVESDSTVRADLTQKKAEQSEFLSATASYFAAVAPMVQNGALSKEGALEIYAATARLFTLGKSTEDALERELKNARDQAEQAANQPPEPTPEQLQAQADAQDREAERQQKQVEWAHDERMAGVDAQIKGIDLLIAKSKLADTGMQVSEDGQSVVPRDDVHSQMMMQALASLKDSLVAMSGSQAEANAMLARVLAAPRSVTMPDGRVITATTQVN